MSDSQPRGVLRFPLTAALLATSALVAIGTGCDARNKPAPTEPSSKHEGAQPVSSQDDAIVDALQPYPRGRWRLGAESLQRVVLFPSHILIRYQDAELGAGVMRYPEWNPFHESTRTRAEARALALKLAQQLRADPALFPQLAKHYSDDTVTRELGGQLGATSAPELGAAYLDALAALRWGEVSHAFETGAGFHIVRKDAPPEVQLVAGERLTIAYRTATPLLSGYIERSRDQALTMAHQLVVSARRDPSSFGALIDQYSEAKSTDLTRQTGVWSTREPGLASLEILALSRVREGEITDPIDTFTGLQILRRIPATDTTRYAFEALRLAVPERLPMEQRAEGEQRVTQVQKALAADITRFDQLRGEHCCVPVEQFTAWKMPAVVERALASLSIGELSVTPVRTEFELFFLRRVDPAAQPPSEPPLFELPDAPPNVDNLVIGGEGKAVARSLRMLTVSARSLLQLEGARDRAFGKACERLASTVESSASPQRRKVELSRTKAELNKILGIDGYEQYMAIAAQWAADELLQNHPVAASDQATLKQQP